jgi:hypothetical protein
MTKLICRVLVGVFLFAQLAVSGYACPGPTPPASQMAGMQAEETGAMPADCDQIDQKAPNLCAEHCKVGQQSHDTAPLPIVMAPALSLLYVLPVEAQAMEAAAAPDASSDPLLAATPPPHAILHCVFRI